LDEPLSPLFDCLLDAPQDVLVLMQCPSAGSTRRNGALHAVSDVVSKPEDLLGPSGVGVFSPGLLQTVSEDELADDSPDLTPLGRRLAAAGVRVQLQAVEAWREYAGNPDDLLELNRFALEGLVSHVRSSLRTTNRIEGRVAIDRSASVESSVIVGPAVIGPDAHVSNAYIGPYTSIGTAARIEGAEIERSIVAPHACVLHVGGRLESSVIGRGARVTREFSVPRALRLRVGDGDEVALC
jgi:glucose-1-phosphate thymidylyltransferase